MKNGNVVRVANSINLIRGCIKRLVPPKTPDHEIDDLVQKVCLISVTKLGQIPEDLGESKVKAWLSRTCKFVTKQHKWHICVSIQREGGTETVKLDLPAQRRAPTEEDLVTALRKLWPRLNHQQRVVLAMWMKGESRHEIAKALGVSVVTVFKRRGEIIAVLKEQYGETPFGIIPPGLVRTQQAHPAAWTVGIMATIALILWLTGTDEDADDGAQPVPLVAQSTEEEEADRDPRGGARRTKESTPPPVPPTAAVSTPFIEEPPPPSVDADKTMSAPPAVPKPHRGRRSPLAGRTGKSKAPPAGMTGNTRNTPPPAETPSLVQQETHIIHEARAAYQRRDYATALTHLDEHAQRFSNGAMATDREELRVPVLCALDRAEEAAIVERVLRTHHDPGLLRCDIPRRSKQPAHRTHTR